MSLLLILLSIFSGIGFADQVTVPLTDPAAQNQSADQQTQPPKPPAIGPDQLYDIKEPILIPEHNRILWIVAATVLATLLLIVLILFLRKRSKKQKAVLAHETALHELKRAGLLIEEENIAAFVNLIDQTLRRYIEQRFGIFARRQTTREFISGLAEDREDVPVDLKKNSDNLKAWLQHCDMVKFAKAGLSRETMMDMAANLRVFIEATKVEAEEK
ncbi:MAG: hypothetical protein ACL93V_03250 [Candidatus Electrothrix sp. YB6]